MPISSLAQLVEKSERCGHSLHEWPAPFSDDAPGGQSRVPAAGRGRSV